MGRTFAVTYDDFSGGHFVDRVAGKQPKNTWTGVNLVAEAKTGYLMPTGRWQWATDSDLNDAICGLVADTYAFVFCAGAPGHVAYYPVESTWPPTINTVAIASGTPWSRPVVFANNLVTTDAAGAYLFVIALSGITASHPAVPETMALLCPYGGFLLAASSSTPNRIFYSAPLDVTSWNSLDYYDVSDAINTMVVHNGTLYIGTEAGWYVATGVPGETFSIRQLNSYPATGTGSVDGDTRLIVGGKNPAAFQEIAGNYVGGLNYASPYPLQPVRSGRFVAGAEGSSVTDPAGWVYDLPTRSWQKVEATDGAELGTIMGAADAAGDYLASFIDGKSARLEVLPATCGYSGSVFYSATAELGEYTHSSPFIVTRVIADVEFDVDPSVITADRSIAVQVAVHGHLDADATVTDPTTTTITKTWSSLTGAGQTVVVPFPVNDCPSTYLATPRVTLKGVKLRRLIMECQEVEG